MSDVRAGCPKVGHTTLCNLDAAEVPPPLLGVAVERLVVYEVGVVLLQHLRQPEAPGLRVLRHLGDGDNR